MSSFASVSSHPSSHSKISADQRAIFQAMAKEAEDSLIANSTNSSANSDGNPWILQFENKDLNLNVWYSTVANSPFLRFKAECHFQNIRPAELMDFMTNDELRLRWDCTLTFVETEVIHEENMPSATSPSSSGSSPSFKLGIFHCGTKRVSVVSGRDFTDCSIIKYRNDGSGVVLSCGVGLEPDQLLSAGLFPVTSEYVRGLNGKGCGWYLQPEGEGGAEGKGTKMTYIIHTDLRGWFFPAVINNLIGGSYVTYFDNLKNALKEYAPKSSS